MAKFLSQLNFMRRIVMTANTKPRRRRFRWQSSVLVIILLIGVLGFLAQEFRVHWDISQNGRNTLSQISIDILEKLDGPVQVTVFATQQDLQLGDVRGIIGNFISVYQHVKPDIFLQFIDPVEEPQLAEAAGVKLNGEMVISFNERKARIATVNEQAFSNALVRLARAPERRLLALSGHGERKLDGIANRDMGSFGKKLAEIGFENASVNLIDALEIPLDASMLIIASPRIDLLEGEVNQLLDYIARGGNMLWLVDVGPLHGLLPLAEKLGVVFMPGTVVDPQAKRLRAPLTFALGMLYGPHAVTENFDYITVFPFARQLILEDSSEWHRDILVEAAPQGWVETGEIKDDPVFDAESDVAGPISIAVALSRIVEDREQRVIVVGSGHFLANTYLGNGGNLDLGINMINWLAGDEALIAIQPRVTIDSQLELSELALTLIAISFLIILPLSFLIIGVVIRWRRKRR